MWRVIAVWVYVCIKCGSLQWAPHPCPHCHMQTVKQWLDDDYLTD